MPIKFKKLTSKLSLFRFLIILPLVFPLTAFNQSNELKAGLEFQWDANENFKRLKWFQKDDRRRARNKIFFFLRPSDRKTGLLKINMTLPKTFKSNLNSKNISLCQVEVGGFESRTKCIEEIPADVEINKERTNIDIYPFRPIPLSKDSYAIVFKVFNPKRTGLYQFHSFGQASGNIPVTRYIGSWTIMID